MIMNIVILACDLRPICAPIESGVLCDHLFFCVYQRPPFKTVRPCATGNCVICATRRNRIGTTSIRRIGLRRVGFPRIAINNDAVISISKINCLTT